MIPTIAKTVVWRHPCDCDTASRPLADGEKPEHRFDVDGQPFPWILPEDHGVAFTRLTDKLWRIDLTFWAIAVDGRDEEQRAPKPRFPSQDDVAFTQQFAGYLQPVIAGIEFPWHISSDGVTFQSGGKMLPSVKLAFFAEDVDTDGPIDDQRDADRTVVDNQGSLWHLNADERALDARVHEATKDWPTAQLDEETGRYVGGWSREEIHDDDGRLVSVLCKHPDGQQVHITAGDA